MYIWPVIQEEMFLRASYYRERIVGTGVRESKQRYFSHSERHVQALWFDDSLRPVELKTSRGEPVVVETAGRWNLEAGPDFQDAILYVGREKRRITGDVEVHVAAADWKNHGHHNDPRFSNVRFHLTWFPGTCDESLFPPGTLHIALCDSATVDLESIDPTAYPYQASRAMQTFPLRGIDPDEITKILISAGEERIRQKTLRMAELIAEHGEAQALYEETASALGYKRNKSAFRPLSKAVSLDALARYGSDWQTLYAVLLGVSGLLPRQPHASWSTEAKTYFRWLWDAWWREEDAWDAVHPLNESDWDFSGLRPLNHPVRRLCALAQAIAGGFFSGDALLTRWADTQTPCFWTDHIGWIGTEQHAELVGAGRLRAIELNIFAPYRLAQGDASALQQLQMEPMNSVIRETAYWLLGPDHSPVLYRSALARQGLIQIFYDFILTGHPFEF